MNVEFLFICFFFFFSWSRCPLQCTLDIITLVRIFFCQFCHLPHQVNGGVIIFTDLQKIQHLLHDDRDILGISDTKKQLQRLQGNKQTKILKKLCDAVNPLFKDNPRVQLHLAHLPLYNKIRMIQTLDDGHLMLQDQFWILLDHVGEGLQAYSNRVNILTKRNHSCLIILLLLLLFLPRYFRFILGDKTKLPMHFAAFSKRSDLG